MRNLRLGLKLFIAGAGLLALTLPVGARNPERISGTYQASFTTRSGVSRQGTLRIRTMGKLLYWLEWRDSENTYSGRGALAGEALLAVWGSSKSRCLAAMLDVDPDGALRGIWFRAEDRNGATSTVEARPKSQEGDDISGTYSVTGYGKESSSLPRDLEVISLGKDNYRFRWTGDEQLEGRGRLNDGSIMVVASVVGSGDKCRISEMILGKDGSLSWKWLTDESG